MEYGIFTLADNIRDPIHGYLQSPGERLRNIIAEAQSAEAAGFDIFALGEHHFTSYVVPNANLMLAAIAAGTQDIRLFTAVTLLPIRDAAQLAGDISLLHNLSGGRVEYSFARGISKEINLFFGQKHESIYDIFIHKLGQLRAFLEAGQVTSQFSPDMQMPLSPPMPPAAMPDLWVGGGVSPWSRQIAARFALPLILPSLFRPPGAFKDYIGAYRAEIQALHGVDGRVALPTYLGVHRRRDIAHRRMRARLNAYVEMAKKLRGESGVALDFEHLIQGPVICGEPAEVEDRIAEINETLGLSRHIFMIDMGGAPLDEVRAQIELMGSRVLPALRL